MPHAPLIRLRRRALYKFVLIDWLIDWTLPKIWVGTFLVQSVHPRGMILNLILTVKMETRHPIHCGEGSFGSEFPAICNHCVVMMAWNRKTLKCCEEFLRFFEKRPPYAEIFKILFRKFSSRHRSSFLCSNFLKFIRREMGEILRYSPDRKKNKLSPASQTVATARMSLKICQGQPPTMYSECSRFHPNRFTFGRVIGERVNTAKLSRKVDTVFGRSLSSSRITMQLFSSNTDAF